MVMLTLAVVLLAAILALLVYGGLRAKQASGTAEKKIDSFNHQVKSINKNLQGIQNINQGINKINSNLENLTR